MRRRISASRRPMVSIPSAFVLLVLAFVGTMSSARPSESLTRALAEWSPSDRELRAQDAAPDAGWRQAVRTESMRTARQIASQRDANAERRERAASADPSWASLATMATQASRIASLAARARSTSVRAPGLPAPSSRAPPLA